MYRTRSRTAGVVALLMLLGAPGAVGADNRIPVDSVDDPTSPTANRIDAVTNIVLATNARLERVIAARPPNPCLDTELTPVCYEATVVLIAYETIGRNIADVCAGGPADGLGASVITDVDAYATDTSSTGIANQLASIATVLGNADDRLGGIFVPPSPITPEDATALSALSVAVYDGGSAAAGWLGADRPPNPCGR
jgi:hypothetical protein